MGIYSFKLPDIGEGIAEAEIVAWHVNPGDWIEEDDPIADMMTDKATVEMTSPISGRLVTVAGEVGDQVAIGAVLAVFETAGDDAPVAVPVGAPADTSTPRPTPAADALEALVVPEAPHVAPPPADAPAGPRTGWLPKILASPAVRERALALAIDLAEVKPGTDGASATATSMPSSATTQVIAPLRLCAATSSSRSSASDAALPRTWRRPSVTSRIFPTSRRST